MLDKLGQDKLPKNLKNLKNLQNQGQDRNIRVYDSVGAASGVKEEDRSLSFNYRSGNEAPTSYYNFVKPGFKNRISKGSATRKAHLTKKIEKISGQTNKENSKVSATTKESTLKQQRAKRSEVNAGSSEDTVHLKTASKLEMIEESPSYRIRYEEEDSLVIQEEHQLSRVMLDSVTEAEKNPRNSVIYKVTHSDLRKAT